MMVLNSLMKDEDYKKIAELDALLKHEPGDVEILVQKGRILYSKMADDIAVNVFKEAIKINPKYIDAYFWLADCLCYHLAEWDEAEAVAIQGLKIDPQRKDLVQLLVEIRQNIAEWNAEIQKNKKSNSLGNQRK